MKSKFRLLEILDLLFKNTDENHYETTITIMEDLEKHKIPVDRKTLQDDMELLVNMGIGIKKEKSSPNKYYWDERIFTQAELQLLIDIVLSSRVITNSKSKRLVNKILKLTSKHNAKLFKEEIKCIERPKTENNEVYKTVNLITEAIKMKNCITFMYTDYNVNKEKIYRNEGEPYYLSPYNLYYSEDNYYVIGYNDKHNDIIALRLDRMEKCKINKAEYVEENEMFDIKEDAIKYFKMYDGEETKVELLVKNDLMKYIIDKFGIQVETEVYSEEFFIARPTVKVSPAFFGWIFQFAGEMKILGPEQVISQYNQMKDL